MRQELRPYQTEALNRIRRSIKDGNKRIIFVLPTGGGKTTVAAEMIHRAVAKGSTVAFLAHRKELISQCSARLDQWDVPHGVVQAGHPRYREHEPVQVVSVQTMVNRLRSGKWTKPFDIIIIDEAHRSTAKSYTDIVERMPQALVLGLTATPCRLNGKPLGLFYNALIESTDVETLVDEGFLMEPEVYAPYIPDVSSVKVRAGEFTQDSLEIALDQKAITGDVVDTWKQQLGPGTRSAYFAVSVKHSQQLVSEFQAQGVRAAHLDGNTPPERRTRILERLVEGSLEVVVNCNILTEGWDLPHLDGVGLVRPTNSLSLYLQMCGRVLRTAPGKIRAVILDHAGNALRHGLPTQNQAWDLDSGAPETAQVARHKNCPKCGLVVPSTTSKCPGCHYKWSASDVRRRELEHRQGELQRLNKQEALEKQEFLNKVYETAKRMRFKEHTFRGISFPGNASHRYKEKYGEFPSGKQRRAAIKAYNEKKEKGEVKAASVVDIFKHSVVQAFSAIVK